MAEQATGIMGGAGGMGVPAATLPGTEHGGHHPGKPISWVAVVTIMLGFVVGGGGLVPHPIWWLFWTGAGIVIIGCVTTLIAKTFSEDWY